MHIKKHMMPRTWPVPRKGTTFIAVARHGSKRGITLLAILRDVLKLANNRKEAKYITYNGMVKVNSVIRRNEDFPLHVFDTISLEKDSLYYRLEIINKKFSLKEISATEASRKIVKIIGKKNLPNAKIQMNLDDGQNFITKEAFSVGDSVLLDTQKQSIQKVLPLAKGSRVEVISGKHAGETGEVEAIEQLKRGKVYRITFEEGHSVSLPLDTFLVIS